MKYKRFNYKKIDFIKKGCISAILIFAFTFLFACSTSDTKTTEVPVVPTTPVTIGFIHNDAGALQDGYVLSAPINWEQLHLFN